MHSLRRCWTHISCPLHSQCKLSHVPMTNGYFQPQQVGEHCHAFSKIDEVTIEEKLANRMGALE